MVVLYEFFEDMLVELVVKCVYDVYCGVVLKEIVEEMVKVFIVFGKVELDCFFLNVIIIVFWCFIFCYFFLEEMRLEFGDSLVECMLELLFWLIDMFKLLEFLKVELFKFINVVFLENLIILYIF